MQWTKEELELLKDWENKNNEIVTIPEYLNDPEIMNQVFLIEAKLLIYNKPVIGMLDDKIEGIYPFKEACNKVDYFIERKKIFLFYPVNFPNLKAYADFLAA